MLDTLPLPAPNPLSSAGKEIWMRKRFEYSKMTAEEFRADLKELGMLVPSFARIFGAHKDTVQKWYHGELDLPIWVPIVLAMLRNHPGALGAARQEAAERIVRDLAYPDRGEFPYLATEEPDDDDTD